MVRPLKPNLIFVCLFYTLLNFKFYKYFNAVFSTKILEGGGGDFNGSTTKKQTIFVCLILDTSLTFKFYKRLKRGF